MRVRTSLQERFFVHAGLFVGLGALSLELPFLGYIYIFGFLALFGRLWADRRLLPKSESLAFSVSLEGTLELDKNVSFKVRLTDSKDQLRSARDVSFRIPILKTLESTSETGLGHLAFRGEGLWEGQEALKAQQLGFEKLERLELVVTQGYWRVIMDLPITDFRFRVAPRRGELSPQAFQELAKNQRLLTLGSRKLLRGQTADQFHSIRKYQFPDSPRHIDPKKTAKMGTLMTRIYDSFHHHHLVMALDVGRSMMGKLGASRKQDYYLSACIALAENALKARDQVSFFAFSQRVEHAIRNVKNMRSFEALYEGHQALTPRNEESNYDQLLHTLQQIAGQRAIVILFSDVSRPSIQSSLRNVLREISQRHLCVVVSLSDQTLSLDEQVLAWDPEQRELEKLGDYQRWLYLYWLSHETEKFRGDVSQLGGGLLLATERDWMNVVTRLYSLMRESIRA